MDLYDENNLEDIYRVLAWWLVRIILNRFRIKIF